MLFGFLLHPNKPFREAKGAKEKTRFNLAVARKGAQKRIKTRTMLLDNIHYI